MIEAYFKYICKLYEKTESSDNIGGDDSTLSEVADSSFSCYIGLSTKDERLSGGIETESATHKLLCSTSVSLSKNYKVKVISGTEHSGKYFDVLPQKLVHDNHQKAMLRIVEE